MPDIHLSVVVPIRDGPERLCDNLRAISEFLCRQPYASEVLLVDDCSEPRTRELLRDFVQQVSGFALLRNDVNRGKGHAVARGMAAAHGKYRVFLDADLAYPIEEVGKILGALEAGSDIAVACRVLPESRYLISPSFFHYLYSRHLMSRAFNLLVRATLLPGILDTQAGLKGFTARASELVFPRLTVAGFGFDVELLYVARKHGLAVTQAAVAFRYDSEPSTVRFLRDGVTMLGDLLRIRWNDVRGRYR